MGLSLKEPGGQMSKCLNLYMPKMSTLYFTTMLSHVGQILQEKQKTV